MSANSLLQCTPYPRHQHGMYGRAWLKQDCGASHDVTCRGRARRDRRSHDRMHGRSLIVGEAAATRPGGRQGLQADPGAGCSPARKCQSALTGIDGEVTWAFVLCPRIPFQPSHRFQSSGLPVDRVRPPWLTSREESETERRSPDLGACKCSIQLLKHVNLEYWRIAALQRSAMDEHCHGPPGCAGSEGKEGRSSFSGDSC